MLLLIAAAAAAMSGDAPTAQSSAGPPAVSAPAKAPSAKDDPNRMVCTSEPVTGSHFTERVCMTKAERAAREQEAAKLMQRREDSTGVVSHQSSPF